MLLLLRFKEQKGGNDEEEEEEVKPSNIFPREYVSNIALGAARVCLACGIVSHKRVCGYRVQYNSSRGDLKKKKWAPSRVYQSTVE